MAGGYDIGASFSASSSSTSGVRSDNPFQEGDFLVGGGAKKTTTPTWLIPVIIGAALIVAVLLIIRR
jgi:hypothetical protein